ncbi:MAG: flagellar hook protein FlgE [Acidobacteria bacterium]|nr:flagellar hook protein FlgE [Acidobacteriota bacterium]
MFSSFATALSALSAQSAAVDAVGSNLANLNTPGYKATAVSFHDLVLESAGAGLTQTQLRTGVGVPTLLRQFSQGAIQSTSGALDAAIQGGGFLIVRDSAGAQLYTRAGQLQVDKSGYLVTATGERVQGWTERDGALTTTDALTDISIPVGTLRPPRASTQFSLDLNLDAAATAGPPPAQFSSSIEVFDSLGNSHLVTVTCTKNANPNQWDYSIGFPAAELTSSLAPLTGTLTFNAGGTLSEPGPAGPWPALSVTGLAGGAQDLNLAWNLYSGQTARITQYAQPSAVSANAQDGVPAAQLLGVGLADGGQIVAAYSSGERSVAGQLALAAIRNPESLLAAGNSAYRLSAASAAPVAGLPGTGGRGNVVGGAIEASNVDLAREFTNLIVFQRSYQANARVVTVTDEMSQETLNLKR